MKRRVRERKYGSVFRVFFLPRLVTERFMADRLQWGNARIINKNIKSKGETQTGKNIQEKKNFIKMEKD